MSGQSNLEKRLTDAALELSGETLAHAFSIPVPNTSPQLFVSLHERAINLLASPEATHKDDCRYWKSADFCNCGATP